MDLHADSQLRRCRRELAQVIGVRHHVPAQVRNHLRHRAAPEPPVTVVLVGTQRSV